MSMIDTMYRVTEVSKIAAVGVSSTVLVEQHPCFVHMELT